MSVLRKVEMSGDLWIAFWLVIAAIIVAPIIRRELRVIFGARRLRRMR
jgi:hypothetical protein